MAVYGYCRVSTDREGPAESLEAQLRAVNGYAEMHRLTITHVFVDHGMVAMRTLADRSEGAKLLSVLRRGDKVITPKFDRMFRSAADACPHLRRFIERNVSLCVMNLGGDITGNRNSVQIVTVLRAVAEAERDCIRERARNTKVEQRIRNRYLGGKIPFGWVVNDIGRLKKEPTQQAAIREMRIKRAAGESFRKISAAMKDRGIWISHTGVKRVLAARA